MRRAQLDPMFQKKSLGQVFLRTEWPCVRMVDKLKELRVERVIEIGPGPGILTRGLVGAGFRVTAIEKDDRFAARLKESMPEVKTVNADVLKFDFEQWLGESGGRAAVVGNIPYNISSPILLRTLTCIDQLTAILLMTQLEFAARVIARPNTKDYGSLSVYAQLRSEPTMEFKVERSCFNPVPKVDSAVMLVTPKREKLDDATLQMAEQVTRTAFTQRRKKLRNAVRQFLEARSGGEAGCPIDLERRPDSLSPREFVLLAKFLLET